MTIQFGADSKLLWTLLKAEQAPTFIDFLQKEIRRHQLAIHNARWEQGFGKEGSLDYKLWQSAIFRHVNDIEDTKTRIREVKRFFGIDD